MVRASDIYAPILSLVCDLKSRTEEQKGSIFSRCTETKTFALWPKYLLIFILVLSSQPNPAPPERATNLGSHCCEGNQGTASSQPLLIGSSGFLNNHPTRNTVVSPFLLPHFPGPHWTARQLSCFLLWALELWLQNTGKTLRLWCKPGHWTTGDLGTRNC
jgi:hypothetical protein